MSDYIKHYVNYIAETNKYLMESEDSLSANEKKHLYGAYRSHKSSDGDTEDDAHTTTLTHLDKAIDSKGPSGSHKGFDSLRSAAKKHLHGALKSHRAAGGDIEDDASYVKTLKHLDSAIDAK